MPAAQSNQLKLNQMMIQGRIDAVIRYEGRVSHFITLPAHDVYTNPACICVKASSALGQAGDDVRCLVVFNGWRDDYKNNQGEKVLQVLGYFNAVG